ncbi:peptidoglycan-binding domain-containing protein [Bosea sp. NBC_00550]|uniref:peptidoglycan-binding domain-containing protein n=1 Tax=Bosea sp. NBC_00550 TaxID=2969621 RepID=UPI003FA4C9B2
MWPLSQETKQGVLPMGLKTSLTSGLAVVALLVAGMAYWTFHESSQTVAPSGLPGAPPPAPQASVPPLAPAPQASAPPPAPAPPLRPSSPPPVSAQSNQPAAFPATSPSPTATAERGQAATIPSSAAPSASMGTLPAESRMSEADRRQLQQVLQRLNYYQGPIDGKFGRSTRAAIRRFQDSIGFKSTGYLTSAEATRLKGSVPR